MTMLLLGLAWCAVVAGAAVWSAFCSGVRAGEAVHRSTAGTRAGGRRRARSARVG